MKFNIEKCKVVHYGKGNTGTKCSMYGQPTAEVMSERDLGVMLSSRAVLYRDHDRDLSQSRHGDDSRSLKFVIAIIY